MKYIIGYFFGAMVMGIVYYQHVKRIVEEQPEIKPCKCVSYSEYSLWQAKYDMYVDKNKPDSVAKYAELLNQIK